MSPPWTVGPAVSRANLGALTEGQRLTGVDLTRAEAAALNRTELVTVQPEQDGWTVAAQYAVGAVRRGNLTVRVTPKIGVVRVLSLLARAYGVTGLKTDPEQVDLAADADLSSVLALLFSHEAATALDAGPLRGYRTEDETLPVLRGRLRIREQYLRRFGLPTPLEVTVDEWTLDTDDNRRIRAATTALLRLADLPEATRLCLRRLDRTLAEANFLPRGSRHPKLTKTRLNARLHHLLALADLVLDHVSVEHAEGDVTTHGFVLNMAWLFEALVARLLREHIKVQAHRTYGFDD